MLAMRLRQLHALGLSAIALFAITLSSCRMFECTKNCGVGDEDCHRNANVCHNPTMHALAGDLDYLESHIDKYGSVVAMQPAVWGQARLTKYREEFEKEMFKDFEGFNDSLQGSLARSDQAFLASATAISAAISGEKAGTTPPQGVLVQNVTAAKGQSVVTPTALEPKDITVNSKIFESMDTIKRTDPIAHTAHGFLDATKKITLEPTTHLDQKARYLNHLNQIRRNNEGDDTADSPGYSLNLVRVPVSVLPGKCTMKGYGAEITMTLKPYISDELLGVTFRQLVINDLVDLLALPVAKVSDAVSTEQQTAGERAKKFDALIHGVQIGEKTVKEQFEFRRQLETIQNQSPRQRNAVSPIPPSQLLSVVGYPEFMTICASVDKTIFGHHANQNQAYILDARGLLKEEINAAYELLSAKNRSDLWSFASHDLAKAIRANDITTLSTLRKGFMDSVTPPAGKKTITFALAWLIIAESALLNEKLQQDIREAAANRGCACQDADLMQFFLPNTMLSPEAKAAFREYVRCRWPIHVFTVDPVSQDQNIADTYSKRQEMQLALTLAFVSGQIKADNMTRYARRIEKDMETIAINRTQIGFSHGEDTFGWRFYPRYQTPEIESNLKTIFRDQLAGGPSKNAELRQTRLEPGMRECVAIVLMPSFVPYVTCETSSNWFALANPKHKEFKLTEAVRLGRIVKSVETCSPNIKNANCYRDGDMARLLAKAKQLEARLPLQNMMVQVPHENTLGGFEMFNTGITDLVPRLTGWYGSPGIQKGAETELFLVGDHYSIHHTKVIAGGMTARYELISRQIMRVIIPAGVMIGTRKTDTGEIRYVDVHVATPYGVTGHLEIPLADDLANNGAAAAKRTALAWSQESVEIPYAITATDAIAATTTSPKPTIQWDVKKLAPPPPDAKSYELTLTVVKAGAAAPEPATIVKVPFTATFDKGLLPVDDSALAAKIITGFPDFNKKMPPVELLITKAVLVVIKKDNTTDAMPLVNKLKITWKAPPPPKTSSSDSNQPSLTGSGVGDPGETARNSRTNRTEPLPPEPRRSGSALRAESTAPAQVAQVLPPPR